MAAPVPSSGDQSRLRVPAVPMDRLQARSGDTVSAATLVQTLSPGIMRRSPRFSPAHVTMMYATQSMKPEPGILWAVHGASSAIATRAESAIRCVYSRYSIWWLLHCL